MRFNENKCIWYLENKNVLRLIKWLCRLEVVHFFAWLILFSREYCDRSLRVCLLLGGFIKYFVLVAIISSRFCRWTERGCVMALNSILFMILTIIYHLKLEADSCQSIVRCKIKNKTHINFDGPSSTVPLAVVNTSSSLYTGTIIISLSKCRLRARKSFFFFFYIIYLSMIFFFFFHAHVRLRRYYFCLTITTPTRPIKSRQPSCTHRPTQTNAVSGQIQFYQDNDKDTF